MMECWRDEGHQPDGFDDVGEHSLGDEVVEAHPGPAGLDALAPMGDLAVELTRAVQVDAQQPVSIRARARAAAAGLDPEQVVQQGNHEVAMEVWPALGAPT